MGSDPGKGERASLSSGRGSEAADRQGCLRTGVVRVLECIGGGSVNRLIPCSWKRLEFSVAEAVVR